MDSSVRIDLPTTKGQDRFADDATHSFEQELQRSGVGNRLRVTFDTLEYVVQNQANRREKLSILKGVSGFCNPGGHGALDGGALRSAGMPCAAETLFKAVLTLQEK